METAVLIGKTISENIFPTFRQHTPEIRICQIYSDRISTCFHDPEIIFFLIRFFLVSIIFMLTSEVFFIILNGVSFVQFFFGIAQKSNVFNTRFI